MISGNRWRLLPVLSLLLIMGCTGSPATLNSEITLLPSALVSTPTVSTEASPTNSKVNVSTQVPTPNSQVCSPLKGIELNDLNAITSFAFNYPNPFSDDFHPAVDLAFYSFKDFTTIHGHPVQAMLPGRVVQVLDDRFPYGNTIIIETPLEDIPDNVSENLVIPTPFPEEKINLSSTCSKELPAISWSNDSRSVYTLYAHLDTKPLITKGDVVTCGQQIGAVGLSGNSVAEHLHLEMRVGPSEAKFGALEMYTASATSEERYNYCIWSISGLFQAIDPSLFWSLQP